MIRSTRQQHFAYLSGKLPGKERNEVFGIQSCEAFQRFSAAYSPLVICKLVRIHSFTLSSQKLYLGISRFTGRFSKECKKDESLAGKT